jgi:hypothetical protein
MKEYCNKWEEKVNELMKVDYDESDCISVLVFSIIERKWNACIEVNTVKALPISQFLQFVKKQVSLELDVYIKFCISQEFFSNCYKDEYIKTLKFQIGIIKKELANILEGVIKDICKEYNHDFNTFRGCIGLTNAKIKIIDGSEE